MRQCRTHSRPPSLSCCALHSHARTRLSHVRAGRQDLCAGQRRPGHRPDVGQATGRGAGRPRACHERRPWPGQRIHRLSTLGRRVRRARQRTVQRGGHREVARRDASWSPTTTRTPRKAWPCSSRWLGTRRAWPATAPRRLSSSRPSCPTWQCWTSRCRSLTAWAARALRTRANAKGLLLLALSGLRPGVRQASIRRGGVRRTSRQACGPGRAGDGDPRALEPGLPRLRKGPDFLCQSRPHARRPLTLGDVIVAKSQGSADSGDRTG